MSGVLFSKKRALRLLKDVFGHESLRPGQEEAVKALAIGRDAMVVMPTGGGKSLCYQLPAVCCRGTTVVVSPLISLMKDQVDALKGKGVRAALINSSIKQKEVDKTLGDLAAGRLQIMYVAPERFKSPQFTTSLVQCNVSLFVIDEAHCVSTWGHDFRVDYRRLGPIKEALSVPTIALTATATRMVQEDVVGQLKMRDPVVIVTGFDRPNLDYNIVSHPTNLSKEMAFKRMVAEELRKDPRASTIVYSSTRDRAEQVTRMVQSFGGKILTYHGGMKDEPRRVAQESFISGRVPWISATNAFGMGIDKPDVRLVVHSNIPGSVEAWYQEVGRAGRDGKPSRCVMHYARADVGTHTFFIQCDNPPPEFFYNLWGMLVESGERIIKATYEEVSEDYCKRFSSKGVVGFQVGTAIRLLKKARVLSPDSPRGVLHVLARSGERVEDYVDFKALEEKKRREFAKFNEMLRFVEGDRRTIRQRVLEYFGEKPCEITTPSSCSNPTPSSGGSSGKSSPGSNAPV